MTDSEQYSLDALLKPEEEVLQPPPAGRSGKPVEAGSQEVPGPAEGSGRRIFRPRDLEHVRFHPGGLVPVIAQDAETGEVLMLAYANHACLALTLDTNEMYFWSRSRSDIRRKGTASGKVLSLVGLYVDCDADTVLAMVRPEGPARNAGGRTSLVEPGDREREASRAATDAGDSTERPGKLGAELVELTIALTRSDAAMVTEAAADLLYQLLVTLKGARVSLDSVAAELARRSGDD